ncbi:MAG: pyridoxal phosphate-dependent aminotransferase [Gemmatimonadales bacterium]|nr:pyridoxal phosphate-dependent aminotransferase [Gemmatimonadales bacterium]
MAFSKIAQSIGASATLKLNARAGRMRQAGEPVIHLGGGEPESQAPESAIAAGMDLLKTGKIRYTPAAGTPTMRDAIIQYTEKFYGRKVERANVMASAGAKQAIMVALMALVDPGDEVVFPVPYWVSYPDMTRLAGGRPVPVKAADGSIQPTLDEMAAAITGRTRVVLLNSPNNPSGQVYGEDFLRGMVRMCEERDVFLMMDDIYHRLVFDGASRVNCYDFTDREVDEARIIVLNGVSKQYAMTGFRIGWAVGPRDLIQAMANIQSHQSGGPCTLSQAAAVAAIKGAQGSVGSLRKTLEVQRDEMVALLQEIPKLKIHKPGGTFYCFCDFSAFDGDCTRLSNSLLDLVQVVTVPGVEFGMPGFLRLSYCGSLSDIREGVRRIKWALDPDGSAELKIGDLVVRR